MLPGLTDHGAPWSTERGSSPGCDREISGRRNLALLASVEYIYEKAARRGTAWHGVDVWRTGGWCMVEKRWSLKNMEEHGRTGHWSKWGWCVLTNGGANCWYVELGIRHDGTGIDCGRDDGI